jgi:hypothetical protein
MCKITALLISSSTIAAIFYVTDVHKIAPSARPSLDQELWDSASAISFPDSPYSQPSKDSRQSLSGSQKMKKRDLNFHHHVSRQENQRLGYSTADLLESQHVFPSTFSCSCPRQRARRNLEIHTRYLLFVPKSCN